MNRRTDIKEDNVISFWALATCECGIFVNAEIDFCLYCIGGSVFVNHEGCGPQLTSYHEYRCPRRDADLDPRTEAPRDGHSGDPAAG